MKEYKRAISLYKALVKKTGEEWMNQDLFYEEFMEDELEELHTIMQGLTNEDRLNGLKEFQKRYQRFL